MKKPPVFDLGSANVWICHHCGAQGPVSFDRNRTAFGLIEKIRAAHKKESPACKGGQLYSIEIVNLARLKAKGRVA
jgi:hypothetical protein